MSAPTARGPALALAVLGGFVALHVASRAAVLWGAPLTAPAPTHPLRWALEVAALGGALGVHLRWRLSAPGLPRSRLRDGLGLLGLAFAVFHVATVRVPLAQGALLPREVTTTLMASLSATVAPGIPLRALAYLGGGGAAIAYLGWLGAGLLAEHPRPRRALTLVVAAAAALGAAAVVHLATGSLTAR